MSDDVSDRLTAALDRFQEAHFWLHMLENYYHSAEPFRWHLNVFLKALDEVPQLVSMALQNEPGFPAWFRPLRSALSSDPLLHKLGKHRNFVVHRGMLQLASSGSIGITKGRGMKLGLSRRIDPAMDSDEAMDRFVYAAARAGDFFGILAEDEDTLPCVERLWRLPDFEDELVDICATSWLTVGRVLSQTAQWLGGDALPFRLDCRHSSQEVRFKLYSRKPLRERLRHFRADKDFVMAPGAKDAADLSKEPERKSPRREILPQDAIGWRLARDALICVRGVAG